MKKQVLFTTILSIILLSGCASVHKGRFSVIDLDLRTPEQVLAQKEEKTIIYTDTSTNKVSMAPSETRSFPYEILFKFLEVMKGRIMIFSLEWEAKDKE